MGEHLLCKQGVVGSIPISSTNCRGVGKGPTGSFKRIREETKREGRGKPVCGLPLAF